MKQIKLYFQQWKTPGRKRQIKGEKTNTTYPIKEWKREKNGRNHMMSTLSKTKVGL